METILKTKINRRSDFKTKNSYIYSQVRDSLKAALPHFNIDFKFDFNKGPGVLRNRLQDRYGDKIEKLQTNTIENKVFIFAPLSLIIVHWSLFIFFNGVIYFYHTQDSYTSRNLKVKEAAFKLFGQYPIKVVKNKYHQKDDTACGAFIICAAIQIAKCLSRGIEPKLCFGSNEVASVIATRCFLTRGDPDPAPPDAVIICKTAGFLNRKFFYCPRCPKKSFKRKVDAQNHIDMAHGDDTPESMNLLGMAYRRRKFFEEKGFNTFEQKIKFVIDSIFK